jgi:hypothetical protein
MRLEDIGVSSGICARRRKPESAGGGGQAYQSLHGMSPPAPALARGRPHDDLEALTLTSIAACGKSPKPVFSHGRLGYRPAPSIAVNER